MSITTTPAAATDKQLEYLKRLGGPTPADLERLGVAHAGKLTKDQASDLLHQKTALRGQGGASDKQRDYLKGLGVEAPEKLTRSEAKRMIEEALGARGEKPASPKQLELLRELGADAPEGVSRHEAKALIAVAMIERDRQPATDPQRAYAARLIGPAVLPDDLTVGEARGLIKGLGRRR